MNTVFFFEGMLVNYIPDEFLSMLPENIEEYDKNEYPHWYVFCQLHLGRPIDTDDLENNAKIIFGLSEKEIRTMTIDQLISLGCNFYQPDYIV